MTTVEPLVSGLDNLTFVRSAPAKQRGRGALSPLEKARKKLMADIDLQIRVAHDPAFVQRKTVNKRDGTTSEKTRIPRSWVVTADDGMSYITPRFSNKTLSVGGKRGSVIRCASNEVVSTLQTVRSWVLSSDADSVLEKALKGAKRRKRQK